MPGAYRLLVLASKPMGMSPSQRYRLEQWAPYLEADHGLTLDFAPFESPRLASLLAQPGRTATKALFVFRDYLRRASVLERSRHYDAVVIHREAALVGPAIYERLLARTGIPLIYDFDDAIWSASQAMPHGPLSRLHCFAKTSTICRIADACTAGNSFLADYALARNPHTFIVPTSIELSNYPLVPEPSGTGKFIVCWTGSATTLIHFELAREALERLAKLVPLLVKVICSRPPDRPIAGAENLFVPWSADGEAEEVGSCHVGIMPLPDDEISRGKCAMKALQYMATGRPVVVSPVGANLEVVSDGVNGFLAGTTEEWVDRLLALQASAKLRAKLGLAARQTIEDKFSAELSAARFATAVHSVLRNRATTGAGNAR
jgi:glycosyltransferase involved in cell wall biosynthesis